MGFARTLPTLQKVCLHSTLVVLFMAGCMLAATPPGAPQPQPPSPSRFIQPPSGMSAMAAEIALAERRPCTASDQTKGPSAFVTPLPCNLFLGIYHAERAILEAVEQWRCAVSVVSLSTVSGVASFVFSVAR